MSGKLASLILQMLVEEHKGVVPETFDELEKLPGVGHKTASVVICTAFGSVLKPEDICEAMLAWFPVSTHMPLTSQAHVGSHMSQMSGSIVAPSLYGMLPGHYIQCAERVHCI